MDLYFAPLACSLATRIALYEALSKDPRAEARYIEVDTKTHKTLAAGDDYFAVSPLGLVPALRTDDGEVLTENAAVLQWVASRFPEAALAPTGAAELAQLQKWLGFIGTELHKGIFSLWFDRDAPETAKGYAMEKGASRLAYLDGYLKGRSFLLAEFSVADAYLSTVLNWVAVTPIDLQKYPNLAAYAARMHERPSIKRAFSEERKLYVAELARHAQ